MRMNKNTFSQAKKQSQFQRLFIFLLLCYSSISMNTLWAQSNHVVIFTGSPSDFSAAEKSSASTNNTDYYITFDASNLYVGAFRTSGNFGDSDNFTLYIDTDPNATPGSGTGTTSGQNYNSVTGTLPFSANYNVHGERNYQESRSFASNWASTVSGLSYHTGANWREVKIPFSSIGSPDALYLTMWMGYGGGIYSNCPGTDLGSGANPTVVNYIGGFGVSSADCIPKNTVNTPITATVTNSAPASGAVIGKLVVNSGTVNASTNNFTIAPGGSIQISGSAVLDVSGRTLTMGGATTGDGKGTTVAIAGTATMTTNSANVFTFNGEGNWTGNPYTYSGLLTINRKFTPLASGAFTLGTTAKLDLRAGSYVNANAPTYATGATLKYNTGNVFAAATEWTSNAVSGIGVPYLVTIGDVVAGTTCSFGTASAYRQANGLISIAAGSSLLLSSVAGGDLKIAGGLTNANTGAGVGINTNGRAVFANASTTTTYTKSGTDNLDFLIFSTTGQFNLASGTNLNLTSTIAGCLQFNAAATLDVPASNSVSIASGGSISGSASGIVSGAGTLYFNGVGSISSAVTFNNVVLNGGVDFGVATTNILGFLQINTNGFVNNHPPIYGPSSTLIYNSGGTYDRRSEWGATSGAGYPNHVQIQNGTTLDLTFNGDAMRALAGNLTLGINGAASAGSLTLANSVNKLTVGGNIVIGGNTSGTSTLTLSTAVGGDVYLNGNWDTKTNGLLVSNTRAVFFQGSGTSTVTTIGAASFDYLFINKTSGGTVSLANDMTVNNNLTLNAQLVTNSFKVIVPTAATVTANATGWVRGNLQKYIPTGAISRTFEIGDSANYTPVTTAYSAVTTAGTLLVATASGDHPQISSSALDATKTANRYYTISNSGVAGGTYDASFTFASSDLDSSATTSNFVVRRYQNPTWFVTTAGTRTSSSTQATGLSAYGNFQLGEANTLTVATHPASSSVCSGTGTTFSSTSSSTPAPTVLWQRGIGGVYTTIDASLDGGVYSNFTTTTLSVSNSAGLNGATYQAVFTNTNGTVTSNAATLTVSPASVGGTVGSDQVLCSGTAPADILLSGNTGSVTKWQKATNPTFTGAIDIASTSTTLTGTLIGNVSATTYFRAVVQSGSCSVAYSTNYVTITMGGATTWTGSWSNGAPTAATAAIISSNYTATADLSACSLTVNNGATLTVNAGFDLTVSGAVTVASGANLVMENNSNLIQAQNVANSGNVSVKRNSAAIMRLDYTLWASPVSGQQLFAFSPLTVASRFYTYNPTTNVYNVVAAPSTTDFASATGYLIRMPNTHPATPTIWNGTFAGVPQNGDISHAVSANTYNAIGNPYPSTLDADQFINSNSLSGALYFWRKTNNSLNTSYATYTLAGGVGTYSNSGDPLSLLPSGVIQVGQGFITKPTSTTVSFHNSMRIGNNSNQFLRNGSENRNRIWLNLTDANGVFFQMLVAYMPEASLGMDAVIDGRFFNDSQTALTSLIGSEEFTIQGRPLPFDQNDVVPLAFKTDTGGNFTIAIDHVDGFFSANQDVFLKDNLTNVTQNLKTGNHSFASAAGLFNTRFELVYQNPLAVSQALFNANSVVVYKQNQELFINTGTVIMTNVKIFDTRGRLLAEKKNSNTTAMSFGLGALQQQVLLVQITSRDGITIVKKVLN